jgi:hypothetical protein
VDFIWIYKSSLSGYIENIEKSEVISISAGTGVLHARRIVDQNYTSNQQFLSIVFTWDWFWMFTSDVVQEERSLGGYPRSKKRLFLLPSGVCRKTEMPRRKSPSIPLCQRGRRDGTL